MLGRRLQNHNVKPASGVPWQWKGTAILWLSASGGAAWSRRCSMPCHLHCRIQIHRAVEIYHISTISGDEKFSHLDLKWGCFLSQIYTSYHHMLPSHKMRELSFWRNCNLRLNCISRLGLDEPCLEPGCPVATCM
jgi:hypothetical protein